MSIRTLPDFLMAGDRELGFPHPNPNARLRGVIGTALPDVPPIPRSTHPEAVEAAGLEWLWHVLEGRIG